MNDLYRDAAVSSTFSFDEEVLKKALKNIYSKDFHPMTDIEENLFDEIWDTMNDATDKGFSKSVNPDDDFREAVKHNNAVFSAFKVHRMQKDMAARLLDSNGNLKPFEQWSKEVLPIADHQVGRWLKTEYDTAVIRAHQAADWQQFEREKDILPNLKWMPSTSIHPGADHQVFWETVRPIDDSFWNSHRPGDRWNCKCSLSATDEPVTNVPGDIKPVDVPQKGLDSNPGKDGIVFSDNHPYFPKSCNVCPFNDVSFKDKLRTIFRDSKKDCYSCNKYLRAMYPSMPLGLNSIQQRSWNDNQREVQNKLNLSIGKPMDHNHANDHHSNPNYDPNVRNEWRINCQCCVTAYELRRRGYDVEAMPRFEGKGKPEELAKKTELIWKNLDTGNTPTKTIVDAVGEKTVNKNGVVIHRSKTEKEMNHAISEAMSVPGRYHLNWSWKNKGGKPQGGHIVVCERFTNNQLLIYDPQSGQVVNWKEKSKSIDFSRGIGILRVDNLNIDESMISEIVKPKKTL